MSNSSCLYHRQSSNIKHERKQQMETERAEPSPLYAGYAHREEWTPCGVQAGES